MPSQPPKLEGGGGILIQNCKLNPTGSSKITLSTDINTERANLLVGMEKDSLGELDRDNKTENFRCCSLGHITINWIMKCDWQGVITYKFIKVYIRYV